MVKGGFFGEVPDTAEVKITIFEGTTPSYHTDANVEIDGYNHRATIAAWLINPAAWQAVGRVRGWGKGMWIGEMKRLRSDEQAIETHRWEVWEWEYKCHRFIDHIAAGKSIEEALAALE